MEMEEEEDLRQADPLQDGSRHQGHHGPPVPPSQAHEPGDRGHRQGHRGTGLGGAILKVLIVD